MALLIVLRFPSAPFRTHGRFVFKVGGASVRVLGTHLEALDHNHRHPVAASDCSFGRECCEQHSDPCRHNAAQ